MFLSCRLGEFPVQLQNSTINSNGDTTCFEVNIIPFSQN